MFCCMFSSSLASGLDLLYAYAPADSEFLRRHNQISCITTSEVKENIVRRQFREFQHPNYLRICEKDWWAIPIRQASQLSVLSLTFE